MARFSGSRRSGAAVDETKTTRAAPLSKTSTMGCAAVGAALSASHLASTTLTTWLVAESLPPICSNSSSRMRHVAQGKHNLRHPGGRWRTKDVTDEHDDMLTDMRQQMNPDASDVDNVRSVVSVVPVAQRSTDVVAAACVAAVTA